MSKVFRLSWLGAAVAVTASLVACGGGGAEAPQAGSGPANAYPAAEGRRTILATDPYLPPVTGVSVSELPVMEGVEWLAANGASVVGRSVTVAPQTSGVVLLKNGTTVRLPELPGGLAANLDRCFLSNAAGDIVCESARSLEIFVWSAKQAQWTLATQPSLNSKESLKAWRAVGINALGDVLTSVEVVDANGKVSMRGWVASATGTAWAVPGVPRAINDYASVAVEEVRDGRAQLSIYDKQVQYVGGGRINYVTQAGLSQEDGFLPEAHTLTNDGRVLGLITVPRDKSGLNFEKAFFDASFARVLVWGSGPTGPSESVYGISMAAAQVPASSAGNALIDGVFFYDPNVADRAANPAYGIVYSGEGSFTLINSLIGTSYPEVGKAIPRSVDALGQVLTCKTLRGAQVPSVCWILKSS